MKLAWRFAAAQLAVVLFATIALTTFLNGPSSAWLQHEPNLTVYQWGWRLSGPLSVTLGALAAFTHAAHRLGAPRAVTIFVAAYALALTAELIGTSTGYPFGHYAYTPLLGYLIAGRVPFPIPLSWFFMVYCSLAICGRVLPARDDVKTMLRWAVTAGAILTAWDVAMDPAMTAATTHWVWLERGAFYGMPYTNWFGWWLTGSIVAFAILRIAPPTMFAQHVSAVAVAVKGPRDLSLEEKFSPLPISGDGRARVGPREGLSRRDELPLVLYAINGIMPIALCATHHLVWAAVLGTAAMAAPLALATREPIVPTCVSSSSAAASGA